MKHGYNQDINDFIND